VKIFYNVDDEPTIAPADKAAPTGLTKSALLNNSLAVPFSLPIRPLSPDTISNLSVEEYAQLQPIRSRESIALPATPPRTGWRGRLDRFWIRNKGLAFMLLAQVFGVLMNVTTRLLEIEGNKGKGMHPVHILFVRMGITFFLASAYMWYYSTPHFPFGAKEVRWLLVARGLGGFWGVFGMYYSLLYLPLADATVITFLAPGLACWACSILIKEPFTRVEQICGLISLGGVVLIARPTSLFSFSNNDPATIGGTTGDALPSGNSTVPDASSYNDVDSAQRLRGVGVALIGVLGTAVAFTVIRWIGKRAHPLVSVNYFAAWCFLVSIVGQIAIPGVGWVLPADLKEWGYLFFLGTCGFAMVSCTRELLIAGMLTLELKQFLLAAGLSYERSSRATNMTYTSMFFALFADKLIFGHSPGVMSIIGSSLILGSAITIAMQQRPALKHEGFGVDEESRAGLLSESNGVDVAIGQNHDRIPVQDVQMRTLR